MLLLSLKSPYGELTIKFVLSCIDGIILLSLTKFLDKVPQPRSQCLSSLPPLVVGRKTLVAAGHVTTQNLGGKNVFWVGGVAEYFICCCDKLCGFQIL